jgi:hypothetical protein
MSIETPDRRPSHGRPSAHRAHVTTATAALVGLALLPLALGQPSIELADAGFMGPESMLHDVAEDVYLVSNINGMPTGVDGNGFISRVSREGEVLELRWIDGASEGIELDAPKGMAIAGDTLFVADITNVRMFDRSTGEQTGSVAIPGSFFLNDVADAGDGGVYVTDTAVGPDFQPAGDGSVYHVSGDGTLRQAIASPDLGQPNGAVATGPDSFVVVTFGDPGLIIRVANGEIEDSQELSAGSFNGVVALDGGDLLVSSWTAAAVLRVTPDGAALPVVERVEGPADIGFDEGRGRVLIPLLQSNEVRIVTLPEAGR